MRTHRWYALCGSFLLIWSLLAQAASQTGSAYALVDSVQMPAWLERNSVRQALTPGQTLRNRDKIITGAEARVLIQMAEGSAVKLGENARLDLNALGRRDDKVFTAALDVVKGAFRFTTGVFAKLQQRRAVNVRIASITAGIRGTDLWGKADNERDLVVLLEGRMSVMHAQDEARTMDEPLSFYVAPKDAAPQFFAKVDTEQLGKWAAETEMQTGGGYAKRGGKWAVELATLGDESSALALYDRARAAGYPVTVKPRTAEGGAYRYAIRLTQLATQNEAAALADKLKQTLQLAAPAVTR